MSLFLRRLSWGIATVCVLCVAGVQPGSSANAAKTSYDCAAASGEVEKLVCADEELAQLDQKLATVYANALKQTKGRKRGLLIAAQIGFIRGKNDCWKAQDVRDCTAFAYRDRIVELQATYSLVPARGPFNYICDDQPATHADVTHFRPIPGRIALI